MTKKLVFTLAFSLLAGFLALGQTLIEDQVARPRETSVNSREVGYPDFMSPHSNPILVHGDRLYVVNTPADTLDIFDAQSLTIVDRINVGIDPVGLALRPDGKEIWVSNHVSDSVSVVDIGRESATFHQVIATVQEIDWETKSTRFDEPVGIAFASHKKAYVALSSENKIAVVDVETRRVLRRLDIPSQDPRALVVRGERLYVIPFESNNQTQISGGIGELDGKLKTFDAREHVLNNNNVLSIGAVVDIVKHPDIPDRDLYVFDTATDERLATVNSLGTLLYGLTVDSRGTVYVAQTDARNEANGLAGTKGHGLAEMENRAFLNQITKVVFHEEKARAPEFIDLEPLPPNHPEKRKALATPYAIQISDDDSTLVVSAASSAKVFTVDAQSGDVLGQVLVEAVPRGIALQSGKAGKPFKAWVLNAVANSVSLVDLRDLTEPSVIKTVPLEDPTHPMVKAGRIAFNDALASTTGTFSCESCHPDGHSDQLVWVLDTPISTGGSQIVPRTTMPVRGLRDTAPYHWDGIPGDPYGGINTASTRKAVEPNSDIHVATSSTRHLVDGGLATTMKSVSDKTENDGGKPGALTESQRDALAAFILNIPYPPAQRRSYDNVLSKKAVSGFRLFHVDGDHDDDPSPNVCGDCHRMPFWVSTNTRGSGMDAPTWRGAYDRWMILPQGRLNIIDFGFYKSIAERGLDERSIWRLSWGGRSRFDPIWNMVLEGSTGFSGAFARQMTLDRKTSVNSDYLDLLSALEQAAGERGVVLRGEGVFINGTHSESIALEFNGTTYLDRGGSERRFDRDELVLAAMQGRFVGTFTGRLGRNVDYDYPQPAIWSPGRIERQSGRQPFPSLSEERRSMTLSGRHIQEGASVIVNGRKVDGKVVTRKATHRGAADYDLQLEVTLGQLPKVAKETKLVALEAEAWSYVPRNDRNRRRWRGSPRDEPFDDSDWIMGRTGVGFDQDRSDRSYQPLLGTDLKEAMREKTSVYIRIPFELENPYVFDALELRMQVDDGFVAYLNGVRIASDRAPRRTVWDAVSDGSSLDVAQDRFDTFEISEALPHLRSGRNILAIHGFNRSQSSSDFIIRPELVGRQSEQMVAGRGVHLLQVQNPDGLYSNEYLFFTR